MLKQYLKGWMVLLIILIGLSGCGKQAKEITPLTPVVVETLKPASAKNTQSFSGIIEAAKEVTLIPDASGVLAEDYVDIGSNVIKGQILAKIEDTTYKAQYESAKAGYELAKFTYEKQQLMLKEQAISQREMDAATAQFRQAESSYALAKKAYEDCTFKAPFNGSVAVKNYKLGNYVKIHEPAFTLINIDQVEVQLAVTDAEISKIKKGQPVVVSVDIFPGKSFPGVITGVGLLADDRSGTYPVKIQVKNFSHYLKPGMVADVALGLDYSPRAEVVSLDTIVARGEQKGVFIVTQNHVVQFVPITVNFEFGQSAKIEGINFGDQLIIKGQKNVVDGEKVSTINAESK